MHRFKLTAVLMAAVLLGLLVACGSNKEPVQQEQTKATADKATRTITHLKGSTVIPAKINKVVVLSAAYIDHLLTIGEKPSGVNVEVRYGGDYLPYLASKLAGVPLVGTADSPNLEAIVQIAPDVILIESRTADKTYEQLQKIAPTIVLGNEWLAYESDTTFWTKDLLTIAEMYDKVDMAKAKIAQLEEKAVKVREKIKAMDNKKLAYLRVREKNLQLYAQNGHPTNVLLYHDLGFTPSALTPKDQRADLSLEKIPELQADYIVLEVDPNARDNRKNMNESALWKNNPAVLNNKMYETDSFWLFKGWGVIGRGEIIDEITKMIQ
ncbi:ABC transporter substrate-binding protein [Paenibacillus sp. HWE-109]|uniref:ABC transporter substrate-binding protein n=1 Tax=Paenibacillus sp. HWE-109 TaxID=1306526 RepID=UPI001EDCAE54|nr:ABC transporter substrate-binding protein [Paenibacillus sp. HWE-109]UKS27055.1 ABC transporter substrate-binding protein [Paenibacillus sp. HWE-109]